MFVLDGARCSFSQKSRFHEPTDSDHFPVWQVVIVRRYLLMLDQEQTRDVILGLVRSAVSSERAATMLREFLGQAMLASLSPLIDHPDRELRASLVVAQLIGIAILRHVVKADAVASASIEELVSRVAPVIEAYLR
jgi:hypothetical protein